MIYPPHQKNPNQQSKEPVPTGKHLKLRKKKIQQTISLSHPPDFDALLKPAKVFINSYKPPFVLNFDQLVDLFANSYGSPHPDQIAINYTNALPLLCYMLHEINPHLKDRSIKTRCTKLREKCEFFDSQPSTDNESDASSEVSSY